MGPGDIRNWGASLYLVMVQFLVQGNEGNDFNEGLEGNEGLQGYEGLQGNEGHEGHEGKVQEGLVAG